MKPSPIRSISCAPPGSIPLIVFGTTESTASLSPRLNPD